MLECVVNISEGRDRTLVRAIAATAGDHALDVHSDGAHNRSVLTLAGPHVQEAARAVAVATVARIDITSHHGAHPRFGAVDVVPFVPLRGSSMADAVAGRDAFARWAGQALELPCFLYGEERTLPALRAGAFVALAPDAGPPSPHPTAGACAVGARPVLVAYNLWLAEANVAVAKEIAGQLRGPSVRALGLDLDGAAQVSCNLIAPAVVGPDAVYDAVAGRAAVARAELVGLAPASVLVAIPQHRWAALDLDWSRTIEARLQQAGLDGGSR